MGQFDEVLYDVDPKVLGLTALGLIEDALIEIGAVGAGDPISGDDIALALRTLNRLIASNNICASSIFTTRYDLYRLTANKQSYTLGTDPTGSTVADLPGTRPTRIKMANLYLQDSPVLKRPLNILTDEEWANKRYLNVATYPVDLYNSGDYPFTVLYFYPMPSAAYQVELWSLQSGAAIEKATDTISYPPGYEDFILYSLAERLCGSFSKSLTQQQQIVLGDARQRIISINSITQNPVKKAGSGHRGARGWFRYIDGEVR